MADGLEGKTEHLIEQFKPDLSKVFTFDEDLLLPTDLLSGRDDKLYHVYLTCLCSDENKWVILKEMPLDQSEIYEKLSSKWNPYLETVFSVFRNRNGAVAIDEYIDPPRELDYEKVPEYAKSYVNQDSPLSLENYIKYFGTLSEIDAVIFAYELCIAAKTIQSIGYTHKDIQPRNVLLTNRLPAYSDFPQYTDLTSHVAVKLIDFDISRKPRKTADTVTMPIGTNGFIAPEVLSHADTNSVDIYSIGSMLQYMVTGRSIIDMNAGDAVDSISGHLHKIILKATSLSYEKRYSLSEFMQTLYDFYEYENLSAFSKMMHSLPGFKTPVLWKNILAAIIYLIIAYSFLVCLISGVKIFTIIFMFAAIWVFFDGFNLMEESKHIRLMNIKHHGLIMIMKTIFSLFLLFAAFLPYF